MANEDDNYKEGVDYVMVDKGGYKTRRFLTKAEKAAKDAPAPKAETPKAKAKAKPKLWRLKLLAAQQVPTHCWSKAMCLLIKIAKTW